MSIEKTERTTSEFQRFQKYTLKLLEEGQVLSGGEKSLVNQHLRQFFLDYKTATGEELSLGYAQICLFAPRVQQFGLKIPAVDRWIKEDVHDVISFGKRTGRLKE